LIRWLVCYLKVTDGRGYFAMTDLQG